MNLSFEIPTYEYIYHGQNSLTCVFIDAPQLICFGASILKNEATDIGQEENTWQMGTAIRKKIWRRPGK